MRGASGQLERQYSAASGVDGGRSPAFWERPAGQCLWGLAGPSEPWRRLAEVQDSVGGALSEGLRGRGLEKDALDQSLRGVAWSEACRCLGAWFGAPRGGVLQAARAWLGLSCRRRPLRTGGGQGPTPESPSPAFQFRISEYAPLNMVGAEQPPSPELRQEGVAEYEAGETPAGDGDAGTQQSGRSPRPRAGPLRGWS